MFHARPVLPAFMFGGAIFWLIVCQSPVVHESDHYRIMLGSLLIGTYTLLTAYELWRERGEQLFSRWPAVGVLAVHGVLFLLPIPLVLLLPADSGIALASGWYPILSLETLLFAIGTAFIILVMAKERSDQIHRVAASTDALTGVSNRRGFVDEAERLIRKAAWKKQPVTVLMFDLDHFKSINDRFGHGTGDEVLRTFAMTATLSLRATDLFGRFGGEEFAAILPGDLNVATTAAERVRTAFEDAGREIAGQKIGVTVSIGAATAYELPCDLSSLLARADVALYRAKEAGRNRLEADAASTPPVTATPQLAPGGAEARTSEHGSRAEDWPLTREPAVAAAAIMP
jgi:diguanylate cyclase (GGDEF)-like protein